MEIQFIWCGKMWSIVLENLLQSWINSNTIYVKTNSSNSENILSKKYNINSWINNLSKIVFICVKPTHFNEIDLSMFWEKTLFISIMAWISINIIFSKIKSKKIIRCMPNTPMSVWKWVIWYFCTNDVNNNDNIFFEKIFSISWKIIELRNEDEIDKITALSWSWPAYFFYMTEIIKNKALEFWFSEIDSTIIANNTFMWAANLLDKSNLNTLELRKNITSKWWTTQKAIETFEKNNFNLNIYDAIESAYIKAKELNK